MSTSSLSRRSTSWLMIVSTSAAGTIRQIARGLASLLTKSCSDDEPVAPSLASADTASTDTSCTTHWCPPRMSRRTMFAPIRPSPTIPSCIGLSLPRDSTSAVQTSACSSQRLFDCRANRAQTGADVRAKVNPEGATPPLGQHLEIAARLRRLDDAECVRLPRHRQVLRVVGRDLQEHSGIGPSLVGLTRGVQEP